jgi:pilus assembly protein CpaD
MRNALTLCAALLLLSACADSVQRASEYDYRTNHPLEVRPTSATLSLERLDRAKLDDFAADYVARGHGALEISQGATSGQDAKARAALAAVVEALRADGIHAAEIKAQLVVGDASLPPGRTALRFDGMMASLPDCYDWREGPPNGPSANYGCNMQRNIGAMVADPRDLLEQRGVSGGFSGERSDVVVGKYGQGADTSSAPMPTQVNTRQSSGQ